MARLIRPLVSEVSGAEAVATVPTHSREAMLAQRLASAEAELASVRAQLDGMARDLEQAREVARNEGREAGREAGHAQARAEAAAGLQQLGALLQTLAETRRTDVAALEEHVVALSYEATLRIVGTASLDEQTVLGIVRQVLARAVAGEGALRLRLSPDDHALLQVHHDALVAASPGATLELIADPRITLGGCVVETSRGSLDGRLQTQFDRLRELWQEARETGRTAT